MKVNGKRIRLRGMEFTSTRMVQGTKGIGRMIYRMVMV
jgi:hypothetical protein